MSENASDAGLAAARAVADKIAELMPSVALGGTGSESIRNLADAYARLFRPAAQGITVNVEKA